MPHFTTATAAGTLATVARKDETFAAWLARMTTPKKGGVSQIELARRLAAEPKTEKQVKNQRRAVLKWLGGIHLPEEETVRRIAAALEVDDTYPLSLRDAEAPVRQDLVSRLARLEGQVARSQAERRDLLQWLDDVDDLVVKLCDRAGLDASQVRRVQLNGDAQ